MVASDNIEALTLQERIYQLLRSSIEDGTYRPGDKLPSENELIEQLNVSRVTVRAALAQLVRENLVVKRQGKGTFVRPRTYRESVFSNGSFTDTCLKMGANPATQILSIQKKVLGGTITACLNGDDDGASPEVIHLERLRLVDGTPCIDEIDYFPARYGFLIDIDLENRSLLRTLNEQTGELAISFTDQFSIACASAHQADIMGCDEGAPLLKVEQTIADAAGKPLYINHQFIVTERYVYMVQSNK